MANQERNADYFAKTIIIAGPIALALFLLASSSLKADTPNTPPPSPTSAKRAAVATGNVFLPIALGGGAPTPPSIRKKGVGLAYDDCASASTVRAIWIFAWKPNPPNCVSMEQVPMIWGAGDISATLGGNSQWILGFNEPDSGSQSNLSAADAATLWRQIEQKYPNRKLVSPAPTGAYPEWLVDFRNAYISAYGTAPRLDALAEHCYAWYASQCITHTQKFIGWANAWNVPEVWVTEFSFSPTAPSSPSGALAEETSFILWMGSQAKVTHYAWSASKIQGTEWWSLPAFQTPLIDWSTGRVTPFGATYLPFP